MASSLFLKLLLNAAAHLAVVNNRKCDRITPVIRQPSLASAATTCELFVYYKCLHRLTASYLVSMITPVSAISTRRHCARQVKVTWLCED